ncbi:MAG: hydrogenase [Gammaproteobacteria bacterium]|nr:hydrogenase [Gammaproteobacteria bacterium]MBU1775540.1 hydrogenase [Gammaproteobacteria bacterium]MBU1969497.1 hydrogenase [Gammaproteobacteria bacterium]
MSETVEFAAVRAAEMKAGFNKLLERLRAQSKITLLDEEGLESFVMAGGDGMVLFTQEPDQQPETWDVAVILPEVLKLTGDRLRAAIISPELARKEKARFGITRWPSLVFVRDGDYVGVIDGMRNWEEYTREIAAMMNKPTGRAPSVGIPVMAAGEPSACN